MRDGLRVWLSSRACANGRRSYHVRWIEPGVGWKSRKVDTDKRRAEGARVRLEEELRRGTHTELRKTSWQAFADEHVERLPGELNAKEARRILRQFGDLFDHPDPGRVTYTMVERFVSAY